jgi:putative transposase
LRFRFILEHRNDWSVTAMCRALQVSRSGFYRWNKTPISKTQQWLNSLRGEIIEVFEESRFTYGSPRVWQQLLREGHQCSVNTVAKIMRAAGIQAKAVKKFKATTDSNHSYATAKNVLDREFNQTTGPNQKWVSDITYVSTEEGWLYLAVVLDLYSRKVIGWSMSSRMTRELVLDALQMALNQRNTNGKILHHSDRGSQYCSSDYRKLLKRYNITCSMSRRGNCWDNAVMESFFATIKKELIHLETYQDRVTARRSVCEYIEAFYNRKRIHSTLGYQTPCEYELIV